MRLNVAVAATVSYPGPELLEPELHTGWELECSGVYDLE